MLRRESRTSGGLRYVMLRRESRGVGGESAQELSISQSASPYPIDLDEASELRCPELPMLSVTSRFMDLTAISALQLL